MVVLAKVPVHFYYLTAKKDLTKHNSNLNLKTNHVSVGIPNDRLVDTPTSYFVVPFYQRHVSNVV